MPGSLPSLFKRFKGFRNGSRLLSTLYCIHGAVPNIIDSKIEDEHLKTYVNNNPYSEWISQYMVKKSYITKSKSDIVPYKSDEKRQKKEGRDRYGISQKEENGIKNIVDCFATIINKYKADEKSSDLQAYLIALTSCVSKDMFLSALLAELNIAVKDYKETVLTIIDEKTTIETKLTFACAYRRGNIDQNKHAFIAINSGIMKCHWRLGILSPRRANKNEEVKNIDDIIDEFRKMLLDNENQLENFKTRLWDDFWETCKETVNTDSIDGDIRNDDDIRINEAIEYVYILNLLYRLIEVMIFKESNSDDYDKNKKKASSEYEKFKKEAKENNINIIDFLESANLFSELNGEIDWKKQFRELKSMADKIFEKIEKFIADSQRYMSTNQGKFKRLLNSAIVIDVQAVGDEVIKFVEQISKDIDNINKIKNAKVYPLQPYSILNGDVTRIAFLWDSTGINKPSNLINEICNSIFKIEIDNKLSLRTFIINDLKEDDIVPYNILGETQITMDMLENGILRRINKILKLQSSFYKATIYLASVSQDDQIYNDVLKVCGDYHSSYIEKPLTRYKKEIGTELVGYELKMRSRKVITIGIITVIAPETKAVNEEFDLRVDTGNKKDDRIYYSNTIDFDDFSVKIIMTEQLNTGSANAVSAFYSLQDNYNPHYYFLIGVAGTIDLDKYGLCDVIIADGVFDGSRAAEQEGKIDYEIFPSAIPASAKKFINHFQQKEFGKDYVAAKGSYNSHFKCHVAPLGDNGHVIKDMTSEFRRILKNTNRKTAVVETESAGFMQAYYDCTLLRKEQPKACFVIRGISDAADENKPSDDKYHLPAAKNAAQIARELISLLYVKS